MVMSDAGLRSKNDCAGEGQWQLYTTDPSSCQRGRPTLTNLQLSDSNKNLALGPTWSLEPRQTDRQTVGPNVTLNLSYVVENVRTFGAMG
jgi:hypothetical protein